MTRCVRKGRILAGALVTALAVSVPAAVGATAPAATTGPASAVSASGAQLTATVNPNGQATTYAFQYGTSTNYGSQTTTTSAGSGSADVTVHATLGGLTSGTTYHYRIVATSPGGTTPGADQSFTTNQRPPSVSASSPSLVTTNSATLAGSVDPNGKPTTYSFQYGPTTGYGLQSPATSAGSGTASVNVHASLSGLTSGTAYHYRLVATSADGTGASPDGTFTTTGDQPAPGGALPVVSGTSVANVTTSSAQLNGAVNPQGPTTTWYFQYGLSGYYGLQSSPSSTSGLGPRPVSAQLGGLQSSTTYHFRLVAYSANGLYVGPDHTFTTATVTRTRPALVLRANVHRRRGSVALLISGSLRLPSAVATSGGCRGAVAVEIRRGGTTIALHRAFLRSNCSYQLTAYISAARLHRASRLGVFERFEGNQVLLPATTQRSVRI